MSDLDNISKADKSRITRLNQIDSAFVMLFLVNTVHTEQVQAFPKELILAICWEESFFQNIPQQGGPAVGYGQLEVSGRTIANQHLKGRLDVGEGDFSISNVLGSRERSINCVSHCLAGLFERLGNSQSAALNGYAGVLQRPANAPIPGRWKDCATELKKVLASADPFNPIAFEDALRKAREFERSGPIYDHIHNSLWPLVDVVRGLTSLVQLGSEGSQVMMVQDSMNRFQATESTNGLASLPLEVDGDFGKKTHARVKEFQARSLLTPDGVVGPMTRGAIKAKANTLSLS